MNNVLDNAKRAKFVIICFYIVLGTYVLMLISDSMQYQLIADGFVGYAEADANDQRQVVVGFLTLGAQLALIITFIQWFRRAFHNLHKYGEKNLVANEGWAAGAWFVPVLSLFRPYQIMVDIWERTKRISSQVEADFSSVDYDSELQSSTSSTAIVGWWWTLWIVTSVGSNISYQITKRAYTIETLRVSTLLDIVTDLTGIICILCAIKMIKESQLDQNRFFKNWKDKGRGGFELADSDEILI